MRRLPPLIHPQELTVDGALATMAANDRESVAGQRHQASADYLAGGTAQHQPMIAKEEVAYAYLFPGIRKVVQAAGRVIPTPSDRGVLHLIDDRFARPEVLRLLPTWWRIDTFP